MQKHAPKFNGNIQYLTSGRIVSGQVPEIDDIAFY